MDVLGLGGVAFGSLKFHNHVMDCASGMVLVLVNCTWPFGAKQPVAGKVKLGLGLAFTSMFCVMLWVQPPVDVNVYVIVCVP